MVSPKNYKDFYRLLGLSKNATKKQIHQAYLKKAKSLHPDRNPGLGPEKFQEVTEAYEVLKDDSKRSEYDQKDHDPFQHWHFTMHAKRAPYTPLDIPPGVDEWSYVDAKPNFETIDSHTYDYTREGQYRVVHTYTSVRKPPSWRYVNYFELEKELQDAIAAAEDDELKISDKDISYDNFLNEALEHEASQNVPKNVGRAPARQPKSQSDPSSTSSKHKRKMRLVGIFIVLIALYLYNSQRQADDLSSTTPRFTTPYRVSSQVKPPGESL